MTGNIQKTQIKFFKWKITKFEMENVLDGINRLDNEEERTGETKDVAIETIQNDICTQKKMTE